MSEILEKKIEELGRIYENEFKSAAKDAKAEVKRLGDETSETKAKVNAMNDRMDALEREANELIRAAKSAKEELDKKSNSDTEEVRVSNLWQKKMFAKSLTESEEAEFGKLNVKTMRTDVAEQGGNLVPLEYERSVIKKVYQNSPVFSAARRFDISEGDSKQIPVIGDRIAFGGRGGNILNATQSTAPRVDAKTISVDTYWAYPYATTDQLEDSFTSVEALISDEAAMILSDTAMADAVNGAQPNGVQGFLTGLPSARLVNAGSTTAFTAEDLIDMKYNGLKSGYWRNARWAFAQEVLGYIRKFTAADDNFLWQPGLAQGNPATILDMPYMVFDDMDSQSTSTNNFAANDKPVVLADWSRFYGFIVKRGIKVTRDEVTSPGLVKYFFSWRVGGRRLLDEAGVVLNMNS